MSVQGLENKVTAAQIGVLLQNKRKEKSALETSIRQYVQVSGENTGRGWVEYFGSLQREHSVQYKSYHKANNCADSMRRLTGLAQTILTHQDLCTRLRARPERLFRLIKTIEYRCEFGHYAKIDGCQIKILNATENTKANFPQTPEEVRANIEQFVEAIRLDINHQVDKCIPRLESTYQGLLQEEKDNVSLCELRVFLRNPDFLEFQKCDQKLRFVFAERFFYSKNLIETLVSRVYRDPRLAHVDKSTLFTREKLLAAMMIKTLCGNQKRHQAVALNGPREAALVSAVKGWTKDFNFIATEQFTADLLLACKQRVEDFDVSLINDEDDLIFKVIAGEEGNFPQGVRGFIADIRQLVSVHSFNHNGLFTPYLHGYRCYLGNYENFIVKTVVQHVLKDLGSPVKQKIEECKVLLTQETSQANSDALLKILVDLYKKGYGLELKNSIFPLFSQDKDYPCLVSFVEMFIKCENYYEAYDFSLLLPSQEQKGILVKQCLQKIKGESEKLLKEYYFWIEHDSLLSGIVDFYVNRKEEVIEPSIRCLFSHAFSSEALSTIKSFFQRAGSINCYERFCSKFPGVLINE